MYLVLFWALALWETIFYNCESWSKKQTRSYIAFRKLSSRFVRTGVQYNNLSSRAFKKKKSMNRYRQFLKYFNFERNMDRQFKHSLANYKRPLIIIYNSSDKNVKFLLHILSFRLGFSGRPVGFIQDDKRA